MHAATLLAGWLGGLDEASLARVLANRPDALLAPEPRSIHELAERLERPESLVAVLRRLPVPCVQVCEATQALGGTPSLADLTAFLDGGPPDHDADVLGWLQVLTEHAVVWPSGDGLLATSQGLAPIFPAPLGLGPSLRTVLADVNVDGLRRILKTLGVAKPATRRTAVLDELLGVLTDPDTVRGIVATAPSAISQELRGWAMERGRSADPYGEDEYDDESDDDEYDDDAARHDPAAYQRRTAASKWGRERGLVFSRSWSYDWYLPAEISRALRGPAYRAPFTPDAPPVDVTPVTAKQLASHAGAAATRFADLMLTVVDRLARTPLPTLKSGGVGAREVAKLAKAVGCAETEVRLCLELGAASALIDCRDGRCGLSDRAEQWRSAAPADRVAPLVSNWWRLPRSATQRRDDDGKSVPVLAHRACLGCLAARQNLLETIAELEDGSSGPLRQLGARARWRRPFVHALAEDGELPFASLFAEGTALGVIASGALTPLGRALVVGRADTLHDLLTAMLPAANDRALFGADLTVVVTGAPTAGVSRLLDACADRESSGAATVWRFTAGSVRRALDEGRTAADLERALTVIATTELPQALRYLIGDVGRQHGNLRVSPAVTVIRGEDTALLTQVAHDRALRKLGLRLLAPTVLTSDADQPTLLAALRKAGYLPMPDGDVVAAPPAESAPPDQRLAAARAQWRRPGSRVQAPAQAPSDPAELAARLLTQPATAQAATTPTERTLRAAARSLSAGEVRMLAHAVDSGGSVGIDYRSTAGNLTHRVITTPDLSGDMILAWCELRADERWFRIDRIQAVFPTA